MIAGTIVAIAFGILFTYILRREVKLPHGEGVRLIQLVKVPWRRTERPYKVENGKVVETFWQADLLGLVQQIGGS